MVAARVARRGCGEFVMIGHCTCVASGLSSHAIARAFGHCGSGGPDLVELLREERPSGRAPKTYDRMKGLIYE